MDSKIQVENLLEHLKIIANTVENMHKPEYATFFLGEEQLDGYQFAERIREFINSQHNNNG